MLLHKVARLGYLQLIVLAVIAPAYLQYLWQYTAPRIPLVFGQSPGIWSGFLLTGLALVFWVKYRWQVAGPWQLKLFLTLLGILWAWQIGLAYVHGDATNYGVWLYPIILGMIFLKCPSREDVLRSVLFAAWLFTLLILVTRVFELQGLFVEATVSSDLLEFERENYWLPLSGSLGPDGRWVGPFFHNSQTGNVAAYLVVLGVALKRRSSPIFLVVGILALLLTSSRTSMVAAVIGVGVALLFGPYQRIHRIPPRLRVAIVSALATTAALIALWFSPNLTGRDVYWSYYLDLWRSSPWTGVGVTGRGSGSETFADVNGHNLVIDALGVYGALAALLVLSIIVVGLVLGALSVRSGEAIPIALIVTYATIGTAQSDYNWTVVSVPWLMLLLPVLLAAATLMSKGEHPHLHGTETAPNPEGLRT